MTLKFPSQRIRKHLEGYPYGPITLYTMGDFKSMTTIGRIAADTLDFITPFVKPGISTAELDRLIHDYMLKRGAIPATIGYHGYQHASCISVNHVAVHGVPRETKVLKEGDIVNIDVTPRLDGPPGNHWHGDTSRMYTVGDKLAVKARRLLEATEKSLEAGIRAARPGNRLGDIGTACEQVALAYGYRIATDFCGHGIGLTFHDNPEVIHVEPEDMGIAGAVEEQSAATTETARAAQTTALETDEVSQTSHQLLSVITELRNVSEKTASAVRSLLEYNETLKLKSLEFVDSLKQT